MKQVFGQPWRAALRTAVEQGGGVWVGIQDNEGMMENIVLFNSPETGSTLGLKVSEVTAKARVFDKIKASNAKFGNRDLEDR